MENSAFLSAVVGQLPNFLLNLAVAVFCLYFLVKKSNAPVVLLLIGTIVQFISNLVWLVFMFQSSNGNHDAADWFPIASGIIGTLAHLLQVLGIILLLFKYYGLLEKTDLGKAQNQWSNPSPPPAGERGKPLISVLGWPAKHRRFSSLLFVKL